MGVWTAIAVLLAGSVLVYACVMCITPRGGEEAAAGHGHGGHGHH